MKSQYWPWTENQVTHDTEEAMLVLTRKAGEKIIIGPLPGGEYVEIEVVQYRGSIVKLGITAPEDILVLRAELADFDVRR